MYAVDCQQEKEGGVEKNKQVMSDCQHLYIVNSSLLLCLSFLSKLSLTRKKCKPFGAEASRKPGNICFALDNDCAKMCTFN